MLDVRVVLLPRDRQLDEELTIGFPPEAARRAISTLIVLTLVPEDSPDAVREFCLSRPRLRPSV